MHSSPQRSLFTTATLSAVTILTLASCASTSPASSSSTAEPASVDVEAGLNEFAEVEAFQDAVDLLPADVVESGELTIAMNVSSAPTKFYDTDNETIIGLNPDIARLLGATLGLETVISNVQFDGIIPALQSDRFNVAVSSMAATPERIQVLDMIDYAQWGSSITVASDNPEELDPDNLCGATIAVQQGSVQQATTVPELATEQCGDVDGITMVVLPSQQDALTQLSSGRVQGVIADTPVLGYAVEQAPDRFEMAGDLTSSPIAIATNKGSELTPALEAAVQHVLELPEYQASLEAWGMADSGITDTSVRQ